MWFLARSVIRYEMGRRPGVPHSLSFSLSSSLKGSLPQLLDCLSTCRRECIFLCLPVLLPVNHPFQMGTKCSGCQCNLTASSSTTNPRSPKSMFLAHNLRSEEDLTSFPPANLLTAKLSFVAQNPKYGLMTSRLSHYECEQ